MKYVFLIGKYSFFFDNFFFFVGKNFGFVYVCIIGVFCINYYEKKNYYFWFIIVMRLFDLLIKLCVG